MNKNQEPIKQDHSRDGFEEKEALKFEEVTIFYNFLFDLGDFVDPTKAARALLKQDFALSAANYYNNDVEVAERFKDLANLRTKAQDLSKVCKLIEENNYIEIGKWIIKQPRMASELCYNIVKLHIKGRKEIPEKSCKHESKSTENIVSFIDDSMVKIQWIEALERDIDRSLFAPQYIQEIPFVRVGLQPFFILLDKEKMDIDVEVLIHRTGVAILRFYVIFKGLKTLDDITKLKIQTLSFESLEIAQQLTEFMTGPMRPPYENRYSSGVNWARYEALGDHRGTFSDVFELYQAAIISVIQNKKPSKSDEPWSWLRSSTWLAYPIIFIGNVIPPIQNYETFKEKYPKELAGLIIRSPLWRSLKDNIVKDIINSDLSITEGYSLFIESSHSLVIYYKITRDKLVERSNGKFPSPEWLSTYLNTSVVIDILLIQRWVLNVFNDKTKTIPSNLKFLNKIKKEILLGLEEYHGITLSYGSAQDIINQRKTKMGTDAQYNNLKQKMDTLEKLIGIEESNKRAQLDVLLKFGALFATAMFGLVGAWRMVEIIVEWNSMIISAPDGWMGTYIWETIKLIQNHQIGTAIFLYSIPIIALLIIILWGIKPGNNKPMINNDQSITAHDPGFKWPVEVKIRHKK